MPRRFRLELYRRHNPAKCKLKKRDERKCRCPIWVTGWLNGQRIPRQALKSRMWSDAEREIDRWQRAANAPAPPTQNDERSTRIAAAVEKYLTHCKVESNIAWSTELSYKKTLEHFTTFLQSAGKYQVGEIDVASIRGYLATRADYTPRTRRKELEHIRFFLWFCVDNEWISRNPATATGKRGVRVKVPKGGGSQPFTDDEINTLLDACERIDNKNMRYVARARLRA